MALLSFLNRVPRLRDPGLGYLKAKIEDICISLSRYGVNKYYVLNTGISTNQALEPTKEELHNQGITLWHTDLHEAEGNTPRAYLNRREAPTQMNQRLA